MPSDGGISDVTVIAKFKQKGRHGCQTLLCAIALNFVEIFCEEVKVHLCFEIDHFWEDLLGFHVVLNEAPGEPVSPSVQREQPVEINMRLRRTTPSTSAPSICSILRHQILINFAGNDAVNARGLAGIN